jgi:hypothetical protein
MNKRLSVTCNKQEKEGDFSVMVDESGPSAGE